MVFIHFLGARNTLERKIEVLACRYQRLSSKVHTEAGMYLVNSCHRTQVGFLLSGFNF